MRSCDGCLVGGGSAWTHERFLGNFVDGSTSFDEHKKLLYTLLIQTPSSSILVPSQWAFFIVLCHALVASSV